MSSLSAVRAARVRGRVDPAPDSAEARCAVPILLSGSSAFANCCVNLRLDENASHMLLVVSLFTRVLCRDVVCSELVAEALR